MIVLALLLFIFSGLFLANTVMNPVESLSYQVWYYVSSSLQYF